METKTTNQGEIAILGTVSYCSYQESRKKTTRNLTTERESAIVYSYFFLIDKRIVVAFKAFTVFAFPVFNDSSSMLSVRAFTEHRRGVARIWNRRRTGIVSSDLAEDELPTLD